MVAQVEKYRHEIVAYQRQLVAISAVGPANGGPGEMKKASVVEAWLAGMGFSIDRCDAPDERVVGGARPNIIAVLPGATPRIWVISHLDVVPPGSPDLWDGDPHVLRQDGDTIYGRGVQDNNYGILCPIFGLKALRDLAIDPIGQVGLVVVSDEETGSQYGIEYVLNRRLDLFGPNDWIIAPDAGRADSRLIEIAEKSQLWLKIDVRGRQAHASRPHEGLNALKVGARIIDRLAEAVDRYCGQDDLFMPPRSTFEPTMIEPGVSNINTIPGVFTFYLDCRVLPPYDLDQVKTGIRSFVESVAGEHGATAEVWAVQQRAAPEPTAPDSPVVQALKRCVSKVRGIDPVIGGVGGGTVASYVRMRKLPVAAWATIEPCSHQPNEYVRLDNLILDAAVFGCLFAGL